MPTRRTVLRGLLGLFLAGLFVSAWAFFIEPALRLRVKRHRITRDDWTAAPLRIAVIADLHVGEPFVTLRRVEKIVARTNALKPDLIVLLGDYAAGHRFITKPLAIADVAPRLARLTAPQGVFAILGNHDWWDDRAAQKRGGGPNLYATALEENGIPVLSNRAIRLDQIWLAGLEDQLAILGGARGLIGLDDLAGTMAQIGADGAPAILLAHEPDIFPQVPDRIALTLSGHTHGGQVRLFGWSPVVPSRYGNRYAYGHVKEQGRDLVVSGGIGCSIAPVRLGVTPEITLIEITGTA
ncbi:metallophosphoesterase [Paracoccus tegillarcae]|uniref:Metallophosphoesterase n=1 Tax=Paracoccus tegillarcae TaxID=1529068 RepID=A0A2K9EWQ9_9RHOB|nr:metallophosphoesterase [Paracoccus tegillarcae]AUH33724.1 metallophosphoesterase [Paracoccus tegillarcae]